MLAYKQMPELCDGLQKMNHATAFFRIMNKGD